MPMEQLKQPHTSSASTPDTPNLDDVMPPSDGMSSDSEDDFRKKRVKDESSDSDVAESDPVTYIRKNGDYLYKKEK